MATNSDSEKTIIYTPRIWHKHAKRWIYPKRGTVFRIVVRKRHRPKRARPKRKPRPQKGA